MKFGSQGRAQALTIVALATLAMLAMPVRAQSVGRMLQNDVRNSGGDAWDVFTAPIRGKPKDWLLTLGALALPIAVSPWDDEVDRWAARHQHDNVFRVLKPVREGGIAFSGRTITPVAVGAFAVAVLTKNQRLQEGLFGCLTAYGATSVVRTFVVYPLIARTRPDSGRADSPPPARDGDQYDVDFPGTTNWGRHSLPGGHLTNVTACATFLSRRFSMGPAEVLPWALAGGVVVGRTLDRRHWLSDEVAGLFLGCGVGKEIAIRSSRRTVRVDSTRAGMSPIGEFYVAPRAGGITAGWRRKL
jgi:membrane-associated phospholipid phosphatase